MDGKNITTWFVKHYKRWDVIAVLAVVIILLALAFNQLQFVREIELSTLDYRFVHYTVPEQVDSSIVLVDIDNNSLNYFMEQAGVQYPFPRTYYALLTDMLTNTGARAVIYDMLFYDPDLNREETYAEETDGQFAQALNRTTNVSLGMEFLVDSTRVTPPLDVYSIPVKGEVPEQSVQYTGALVPIDTLRHSVKTLGATNIRTDGDGVVRRVRLLHEYHGNCYPNLPLSGWLTHNTVDSLQVNSNAIRIEDKSIPIDEDGNYLVNWYGSGGPDGVFPYITISSAIQTAIAEQYGGTPSFDPEFFRDKYVIIGASASGLKDLKPTPFTGEYSYPGMEIWATVLSNILQEDYVRSVPLWANLVYVFILSFLTLLIFTRLRLRYSNLLMLVLIAGIIGLPIWLWNVDRIWMEMAFPATAFIFSFVFIAIVSFMVEGRSRLELRRVFTRYVHPDVIQNLMEEPDLIQLGGDEIYATVMFSDIYNFTSFSEGKSAPELVQYLNEYFNTLTGFVLDYNGLLDKYTGDGIMAIFGAPIPRDDHARLACEAALAHRNYSEALVQRGEDSNPSAQFHVHTRIGLNSGYIVAGNIGSERRTDYTAIGDDVNLAARLEGVNKIFHTKIIISESTYALVKQDFLCRELDMLRVKGKKQPVKIYQLLDHESNREKYDFELIDLYHEALEEYRQGNWSQAMEKFSTLSDGKWNDKVSETMFHRCQILQEKALADWDGIFTLETK